MRRIREEESRESARSQSYWNRLWPRWVTAGCAAALLLFLIPMLHIGGKGTSSSSSAAALFAQSAEALAKVQTVHMTGRIRTLPGDNFELIGANYDFVPIEIWREYGNPPRWRVEKPGRVAAMDGERAIMYMSRINQAVSGTPDANFFSWLRPLLDPQTIVDKELADRSAIAADLSESNGFTTAVVRRNAQGQFANDYARNKSVFESDHTCIYRFDSASKRLEGVQVNVTVNGREITVAEFTGFRYNERLPSTLFSLQLPADVAWYVSPSEMKPPAVTLSGPKDAAAYFFDSLAHERWDDVLAVMPTSTLRDSFKTQYGGLQLVSLGEPFQSGIFPGYFVPYQIRLRDGQTRTHNLAVKNTNPAHRWVIDGGI